MRCFHPITAYRSKVLNENGKRELVFDKKQSSPDYYPLEISCGRCTGCRLKRSKQWAIRCVHHASMYDDNRFLTLTFSDEGLEKRQKEYELVNRKILERNKKEKDESKHKPLYHINKRTVNVRDFQLFMKKLRKEFGQNISYYHCGEYGELCRNCGNTQNKCLYKGCKKYEPELGRPHYHACIFNFRPPDEKEWPSTKEHKLYVSERLNKIWGYGYVVIGDVTFESAGYVARYVMKKLTGQKAYEVDETTGLTPYEFYEPESPGEINYCNLEYTSMSKGIGKEWFKEFKNDLYPKDYIMVAGRKCSIPKYYDKQLEREEIEEYEYLKDIRKDNIDVHHIDNTVDRLETIEKVTHKKIEKLVRNQDI